MAAQNEPSEIPNGGENVHAWSRQDIQDAFQHLDTSDANAQAVKYAQAATDWDQGLETFKRSVGASISEAWEGASAEAAKKAITEYTTDGAKLTDLLSGLGKDITAAANAVVQTKNGIKPAAEHSWTTNIPFFGRAQAASEEHTRTQNEADTRDAMQQHYVTQFGRTDRSVPVLPASLNPMKKDGVRTGPDSSPGPSPSNPTTPGSDHSANSNQKNPNDKDTKDSKDPSNQAGDQNQSTNPNSSSDGSPTASDPTSTTQSSANDSATDPSSVSPSSFTPGGGGGGGGIGGAGGELGTSGGGAGHSVPGTGGTANAGRAAAAAAGSRAAGSAPGMGGMGGLGGQGKGGKDEDRSHATPDYLINAENTEELIGELPRLLPGGVIGGDTNRTDPKPPAQ